MSKNTKENGQFWVIKANDGSSHVLAYNRTARKKKIQEEAKALISFETRVIEAI